MGVKKMGIHRMERPLLSLGLGQLLSQGSLSKLRICLLWTNANFFDNHVIPGVMAAINVLKLVLKDLIFNRFMQENKK